MEFPEQPLGSDVLGTLPQFSELRGISASSVTTSTSGGNTMSDASTTQDRSVVAGTSQKQPVLEVEAMRNSELLYFLQMQSSMQYATRNLSLWPAAERLLQLCENVQINVPNYGQNNAILDVQPNNLQAQLILGNMCAPQQNIVKQELDAPPKEETDSDKESDIELQQRQVAQYFQQLQATSLPHTLQHIIKQQTEQVKKEKEEEKVEHVQNNILNIPNIFRNIPLQNNSSFASPDAILTLSPDIALHVDTESQENDGGAQPVVLKVEQQVQTDSPKLEKRSRFRAKLGEIKVSLCSDGSVLYCCPECNIGLPDKVDVEQHVQAHLQERKHECKECGAMLKRKEHLDQHMRGHSDDRPFKCMVCNKGFKRNEHLTRHYVIHSGNKNFTCTKCQKAFSRKDHLNKHMQTHLGIRKGKTKEDSYYVGPKDKVFDRSRVDVATTPKQELVACAIKDDLPKQEFILLRQIQHLQKNPQLLQTFREQALRNAGQSQQEENISINDLLSQNVKYLMPS